MRKTLGLTLAFGLLSSFTATPALASCPDDQYESCLFGICVCNIKIPTPVPIPSSPDVIKIILNPKDFIDPTGIPMQSDFTEYMVRNPETILELADDPRNLLFVTVAHGMISSRNAIVSHGNRMPEDILQRLRPWYDESMMRGVRWTSDWGPLQSSLQAAWLQKGDTRAITAMNGIVFLNDMEARDPVLWAHELRHVQQYRDWGVFVFARKWVLNSAPSGEVESEAYAREAEVANALGSGQPAPPGPAPFPPIGGMEMGTVCVTPVNSCAWINPKGWQCSCASPYGLQAGIVR